MYKAILFEAHRVLVRPVTGHWLIPSLFFEIIPSRGFYTYNNIEHNAAFAQAAEVLADYPVVQTKEDELQLFIEYYRMFFACLPRLQITNRQIEAVAADMVYNPDKFEFHPDAMDVIHLLKKTCNLAVAADSWPSLEDVFQHAGMRHHFSSFVISTQLGLTKPDPRLFQAALDELNVSPHEALYVDDNKSNCDSARSMGMRTVLLHRDGLEYIIARLTCRTHTVIRTLRELPQLIGMDRE